MQPTPMQLHTLRSLYKDQGALLADRIYKTIDQATDVVLDLEDLCNQISSQSPALNPLRAKQTSVTLTTEQMIETTIETRLELLQISFEKQVSQHGIRFGPDPKTHTASMISYLRELVDTQIDQMKSRLAEERVLEPIKSVGNTLALIQLKFKVHESQFFPLTAPLETHFTCKIPVLRPQIELTTSTKEFLHA